MERKIIFYESYFQDFYLKQDRKVREKIAYVFKVINSVQNVPTKFLKHLEGTDGLYEIRIEFESNIYRIFAALTKEIWLYFLMLSKKRHRKRPKTKLI